MKDVLIRISDRFLGRLKRDARIFTTNFDTIFDPYFDPKHIHGKFVIPLDSSSDVILFHLNEAQFEHKYLFGTNGLEKLYRLNIIKDQENDSYDTGFFYNHDEPFGHLLIFGIAFGKAEVVTEKFLKMYPQYRDNQIVQSVDGHILERLNALVQLDLVERISIMYYSNQDLENYMALFANSDFKNIIDYIDTNDL